jgi:hypothetical protein
MTIPASAPRRYTTSRQLIAGDDFNNLSDHIYGFASIAALGATQAAATQITASNIEVTLANSINNGGIILPNAIPGQDVSVLNNNANTTKVYPQGTTDVIQNGATGFAAAQTAVTMATGVNANFFCIKKGFWQMTKTTGP